MSTSNELATIEALEKELIGLVEALPEFKKKTYSIFSLADLERLTAAQSNRLPLAGVGYDGCAPVGNEVDPKSYAANAVVTIDLQFLIVLVVSYSAPGENDTKQDATNLLGEIRSKVIGYKKVNTRAWRFIGERPEPAASGDGLIFYSQVWRTAVIVKGNSSNLNSGD